MPNGIRRWTLASGLSRTQPTVCRGSPWFCSWLSTRSAHGSARALRSGSVLLRVNARHGVRMTQGSAAGLIQAIPRQPHCWPRSPHLERSFHFDRDIVWQCTHTNGHPCVVTGVAKKIYEQVGGTIHDLRLANEVGGGVHIAREAYGLHKSIQIAVQGEAQVGKQVQGAQSGRLLPLRNAELPPELADESALAVPLRELPGQKHQVARAHERRVVRAWLARLRQLDPQLCQARLNPSHHCPHLIGPGLLWAPLIIRPSHYKWLEGALLRARPCGSRSRHARTRLRPRAA